MQAEVCSIYLYDEKSNYLTLAATEGLAAGSTGRVKMYLGEGLTGKALKEYRTIREAHGSRSPFFKPFPGTNEERFEAFLSVPVHIGLQRIGAIVLQHSKPGYFSEHDAKAIRAIAAQLASLMENARLLLLMNGKIGQIENRATEIPKLIRGQRARAGIAVASAVKIDQEHWIPDFDAETCTSGTDEQDFRNALDQTIEEISGLQKALSIQYADVASLIFSSHLLMLQDISFSGKIIDYIHEGIPVRDAIIRTVEEYIAIFDASENTRVREKVLDLKDLGHRILRNLDGDCLPAAEYTDRIIVAREMLPSQLLKIAAQGAEGMILYGAGASAHVTILAKSLNIPVLFTDNEAITRVPVGSMIIIDANQENIFIEPDQDVVDRYRQISKSIALSQETAVHDQTLTKCGRRITLMANINILSDLQTAVANKAEGIGLYRSEFPFLIRNDFPSEEEQVRVYSQLFAKMEGKEVTLRTLDIGGDKILSYLPEQSENNPFLGLRALRFSLKNRDIFRIQLRAMLRAGSGHDIRIMFPLVSALDDFLEARKILADCIYELKREGASCAEKPKVGAMVELPSLIEVIDEIAQEADFLCIGTNDLVQYLLGVDRTNKEISYLYVAHHPSVFRTIKRIIDASGKNRCDLSICGEIAADPHFLSFLAGSGLVKISLDPHAIPAVQQFLEQKSMKEMHDFSQKILSFGTIREVNGFLQGQGRNENT